MKHQRSSLPCSAPVPPRELLLSCAQTHPREQDWGLETSDLFQLEGSDCQLWHLLKCCSKYVRITVSGRETVSELGPLPCPAASLRIQESTCMARQHLPFSWKRRGFYVAHLKILLYKTRSCGRGRQTGVIHPTQALLPLVLLVLAVTKPITPACSQQAQIHGAGHADDGAAENHPVSLPLSTFFKK